MRCAREIQSRWAASRLEKTAGLPLNTHFLFGPNECQYCVFILSTKEDQKGGGMAPFFWNFGNCFFKSIYKKWEKRYFLYYST